MVKVKDFEFSLREFAGALGDFGPLNPFVVAYITVLGLNPVGILLAMGFINVVLGFVYKVPLPVEPQKAVGAIALDQRWNSSMVYGTGVGMGLVWLFLAFSGAIKKIAKFVPACVIVGVQLGLALTLLRESLELMSINVALAIAGILLVILFIRKYLPAGLMIFALGLAVALVANPIDLKLGLYLPEISIPDVRDVSAGMLTVGIAQIALTLSNAVFATSLAVNQRFPRSKVNAEGLAKSTGLMNAVLPLIGGVPMCHGAGGFASQYFFGARTGGAMLMEGIVEVILALFLADSVASIFSSFPSAIIGVMLLFASLELGKFVLEVKRRLEATIALIVGALSFFTNLGMGFFVGLLIFYLIKRMRTSFA